MGVGFNRFLPLIFSNDCYASLCFIYCVNHWECFDIGTNQNGKMRLPIIENLDFFHFFFFFFLAYFEMILRF